MKGQIGSDLMKEEYLSIDTITRLVELEKENKELQDRLDKAIEYINDLDNCKNVYANGDMTITNDYKIELLDILKGEDNE